MINTTTPTRFGTLSHGIWLLELEKGDFTIDRIE